MTKIFGAFLLDRIKMANVRFDMGMSNKQWGKIADSYIKNFDPVKHKKILDIVHADAEIERQLSRDD